MITKFLKFFSLILVLSLVLTSCNKEELNPETPETPTTEGQTETPTTGNPQIFSLVSSTTTDSTGCFVIDFPITFVYEDGTTATAESEEDLIEILDSEPYPVDIAYPINLVNPETGETLTANNEVELIEIFANCDDFGDDGDWDDDDEDDGDDDDDGDYGDCDDIDVVFGTLACYELQFPLSFITEDGSTVTAESEDDLQNIFDLDNPPVDFEYPVNLTNEEGETVTANDEDELEDLIEECFDGDWGDDDWGDDDWDNDLSVVYPLTFATVGDDSLGFEACYSYVFPVSLVNADEETVTVQTQEELMEVLFGSAEPIEDFEYPVQVTDNDTGEVLTANNEEEVIALLENCEN